jgi:hypothetical protein
MRVSLVLLHAHTTWSHDGSLTPDRWITIGREMGLDAVYFTEHEESGWSAGRYREYCRDLERASGPDVRLVPGIEFQQEGYHVLCYGLQSWPDRPSGAVALAAAVHGQGCILCLAHPMKYGWKYPAHLLEAADAVEVWNAKWIYDGATGPHPRSLALAPSRLMLAGQDVHKMKHLSGVLVQTRTGDVLGDLRKGEFVIVLKNREWNQEALRRDFGGALLPRLRNPLIRGVVAAHKSTKPIRKALSRGKKP